MIEPDQIIYLDNNATTQLDPAVVEEMTPFLTKYYGNPSSPYGFGAQVRDAVELARERVAALIGCIASEITFTSGGTEANNTALNSALQLDPQRRHIVTTAVEHSATRRQCEHLARTGYEVSVVAVDEQGRIDLGEIAHAIRSDTAIVSVMWANNETGVLFPIPEIAHLAREKRVLFHTDAIQAAGKIPIDVGGAPVSYLSLSAHKIHGPKGVGALYVNRRVAFRPSSFGGEQENTRRAGTENVASIVGFGKAAERAAVELSIQDDRVRKMRDDFERAILAAVPNAVINGDPMNRLPNTSSISFRGVEATAALILFDQQGLCCSAGSACRSGSPELSHVLRAMEADEQQMRGSIRFSFGHFSSDSDLKRGIDVVLRVMAQLRRTRTTTTRGRDFS
ncbi:MAG: aminotransferase class V-fold PLP-dependent enzyme [Verrucomicrobiota bacterium]|nr:aminotransferase class V-fold PLP-dependent enzyme [Verrucomicrobiota bacterium]